MSDDDDLETMRQKGLARTRIVAWAVIIALVLGGGGATLFALFQG